MLKIIPFLFATMFSLNPLPSADAELEPSIQNEVDHAVYMGVRWLEKNKNVPGDVFVVSTNQVTNVTHLAQNVFSMTNKKNRTQIALHFISLQRGEGWWVTQTNSAPTKAAIKILKGL
ncbi:MAG: hypothetical protein J6V88_01695 [Kiritimatiellae bacterium]|nr:hypothetical protein [Kiritimatiellia bacterium]